MLMTDIRLFLRKWHNTVIPLTVHKWRKVICYLMMPLVVAEKAIEGELPEPILGGENGEKT